MIRPIDIQILHSHAPEFSNRQQVDHQRPNVQQGQLAEVTQKEQMKQKDKIVQMEKGQKVRYATEQKGKKQGQTSKNKKDNKYRGKKKTYTKDEYSESQFDIRI